MNKFPPLITLALESTAHLAAFPQFDPFRDFSGDSGLVA